MTTDLTEWKPTIKSIPFHDPSLPTQLTVHIQQLAEPSYGCYLWPGAFVLADYLWSQRHILKGKCIMELGAGTGLPGILLACWNKEKSLKKCGKIYLTETSTGPALKNLSMNVHLNYVSDFVTISPVTWGLFQQHPESILNVLNDMPCSLNYIIGSDVFFDSNLFETLIVTVAFIMEKYPKCIFITSYQERSSKRSIQMLLEKWDLKGRFIKDEEWGGIDMVRWENEMQGKRNLEIHSVFLLEIRKKDGPGTE